MKTVLFTFPSDTVRDKFFKMVKEASESLVLSEDPLEKSNGEILKATLNTIRLDPPLKPEHERVVAMFVGGKKLLEGTLEDLKKKFQEETAAHKASVDLKELREGEWVVIQSRRMQPKQN